MNHRVTVWVEVIPVRSPWGSMRSTRVGKTFKRRPKPEQLTAGAIVVEVELGVPTDRLEHVVRAVVPSPDPVSVTR